MCDEKMSYKYLQLLDSRILLGVSLKPLSNRSRISTKSPSRIDLGKLSTVCMVRGNSKG